MESAGAPAAAAAPSGSVVVVLAELLAPAPAAAAPSYTLETTSSDGHGLLGSPGFLAGVLLGCTALAVLLWVAIAFETRRQSLRRENARKEAALRRVKMALPVVIVQPDESIDFGAKLYRTASGDMRVFALTRPGPGKAQPLPVGLVVAEPDMSIACGTSCDSDPSSGSSQAGRAAPHMAEP